MILLWCNKSDSQTVDTLMKQISSLHGVLILLLIMALSILETSPCLAEYIEPGSVEVKTTAYHPQNTDFDKGTYHYEVSWQGIPVAQAQIIVGEAKEGAQEYLNVKAEAKTGDFIDIFYRLRFSSQSLFEANSFKPIRFESHQKENSREKVREVTFGPNGKIKADYVKNGNQEEPVSFQSKNATFDPISAAFLARSLPLRSGETHSFDVFNGKHRYLISFEVKEKEKIEIQDSIYEAFKVIPTVQKLTDSEGEKRLEQAAIWISSDDSREVLKLESKVLVGKVNAHLVKFVPQAPQTPVVSVKLAKASF